MKSKKIIVILLILITIIGFSTISNAALESKAGQDSWINNASALFTNIREMEKSGGTLGQNAIINGTTYLDSSNNGIDVHMALATEWGTAAILAVSDYGTFNTKGIVNDAGTNVSATTGNITGIFKMADGKQEYVAGLLKNGSNAYTSAIYSADKRYRNEYTTNSSEYHKGDAIYQTAGWYNGGIEYVDSSNNPIFYRKDGLFGFYRRSGGYSYINAGWCYTTRAVVVCGEGL